METILIYLLKSSALMIVFYLAYFLLLRKETFFNSNRWFLLAGLFTAVLLPLVFFTNIIEVEPVVDNFDWNKIPITTITENISNEINWWVYIAIAYLLVVSFLILKLAFDFFSIAKILKGRTIQNQEDYKFIDIKENLAPFSYFNYIVYNSDLYSASELENILEHEKVHSAQNHSVDVIVARLFCIVFWYNPFIWLYKKAILQNLEFIADSEATKNIADKKSYQFTLLKITTHENCVAISNHFYQSLIKKRIVMLNKNQSNRRNYLKYAFIIPVVVAFVFLFQIKVVAQEKVSSIHSEKTSTTNKVVFTVTKNTSDAALKKDILELKNDHAVTVTLSKLKRNANGEITSIKISFKDEYGNSGVNQASSDKPINPISFAMTTDENGKRQIGFFTPDTIDKEVTINTVKSDNITAIQEVPSLEVEIVPLSPTTINVSKHEKQRYTANSINRDFNPLMIIDGVKSDSGFEIDTFVIIDILERLDAVAKYGIEGENGVVEITTKKTSTTMSTSIDDAEQAKLDAIQGKKDAKQAKIDAVQAKSDAQQAKLDAHQARKDVQQAKIDATHAKKMQ